MADIYEIADLNKKQICEMFLLHVKYKYKTQTAAAKNFVLTRERIRAKGKK